MDSLHFGGSIHIFHLFCFLGVWYHAKALWLLTAALAWITILGDVPPANLSEKSHRKQCLA